MISDGKDMNATSEDLYSKANQLYTGGNVEQALELYQEALNLLPNASDHDDIRQKLNSNLAICHLKSRNYQETIEHCNAVLSFEGKNMKALARRSVANENLGNFAIAIEDVERILEIYRQDDGNKYHPIFNPRPVSSWEHETVNRLLHLQHLLADDLKAQQAELNSIPSSFVTEAQTLNLRFSSVLPSTLFIDQSYTIRLSVCNEFGLWHRSSNTESNKPLVLCDIILLNMPSNGCFAEPDLVVQSSSENRIGENGRVEFRFNINCSEAIVSERYIMMKFYCESELSSGRQIIPIISRPLLISSHSILCRMRGVDIFPELHQIAAKCIELGGESIKTWEPILDAGQKNHSNSTHDIYAIECPGSLGIGGKVWDATYGLLEFFSRRPQLLNGKVIVELGSGTGLAGLGLCNAIITQPIYPLQVILTDVVEVISLLNLNIQINKVLSGIFQHDDNSRSNIFKKYKALPHSWGESTDNIDAAISRCLACDIDNNFSGVVIIASDVVYDPTGYQPLVTTISGLLHYHQKIYLDALNSKAHCQAQPPFMVLAHRHRNPENRRFFDMLYSAESRLQVEKQEGSWIHAPADVELYIVKPWTFLSNE